MAKGAKPARPISSYERAACPRGSHDCRIVFQIGEVEGYAVCAAFLRANEVKPAYDMVHGVGAFDALRGGLPLGEARDKARNRLIADDYHVEPPVIRDPEAERLLVERLLDEETTIVEPEPVQPEAPIGSIDSLIDARISHAVENGRAGVDPDKVLEIVAEFADTLAPKVTAITYRERETIELPDGSAHKALPKVLSLVNRGKLPWLVGPAGTGKSTLARQVAEVLGLSFWAIGCNPMMSTSALFGFVSAMGETVRTGFREAYEHGGVALIDEIDASHPGVLTALNDALANGSASFPDGMVKRHDDFVCVVAANTYGRGANREYVGRNQLDAATVNRFKMLTVDYDVDLERSLALAHNPDKGEAWHKVLLKMRDNRDAHGIKCVVSTRSVMDCDLLGEFEPREVLEMSVFQGLDESQASKMLEGCSLAGL